MKALLNWLRERRKRLEQFQLDCGYNFAAGKLLAGVPVWVLQEQIDDARFVDEFDKYEEGIELAITHWQKRFTK